jgi:hypothetical protein
MRPYEEEEEEDQEERRRRVIDTFLIKGLRRQANSLSQRARAQRKTSRRGGQRPGRLSHRWPRACRRAAEPAPCGAPCSQAARSAPWPAGQRSGVGGRPRRPPRSLADSSVITAQPGAPSGDQLRACLRCLQPQLTRGHNAETACQE